MLSYKIKQDGTLQAINAVQSHGSSPCFLDVSHDRKYLLTANYDGSSFAVFPLNNGTIGEASFVQKNPGHGPNPDRQAAAHPHQFLFAPLYTYAFVCDLGLDKVFQFSFNYTTGTVQPNHFGASYTAPAGSGPRHLAFHPKFPIAYLSHELSNKLSTLKFNHFTGVLTHLQTVDMLPKGVDSSKCTGAEVRVSPDGLFVYASNRGASNTIAIYRVNQNDGTLTNIGFQETLGQFPRFFMFDATSKWVIVANQNSNNIVVFSRDFSTGMLTKVSQLDNIVLPTGAVLL
jgi:6-phosphogluconolactonase